MYERQAIARSKRRNTPDNVKSAVSTGPLQEMSAEPSPDETIFHVPSAMFDFNDIAIMPVEPQVGAEGGDLHPDLAQSISARRGNGAPLAPSVQRQMEGAFGHNFARVRVHADGASDMLNRSLNANAFTLGSDIFLSQEATRSGAYGGDRLLAHELTHVIQQHGAEQNGPLTVTSMNDPEEQEASAIATAVSAGNPARALRPASSAEAHVATMHVQRDGDTGKHHGKAAPPKPTLESLAKDVEDLKRQQAVTQKQQKAVQLDLEWRAKFGQKMASYKQSVWRITGGIDAANKGFQDAQVAQAQTDQMWAQLIGLGVSVVFAGGFEWIFGGALGKIGPKLGWGEEKIKDIVEKVENPANAAVGGYMTNVRSTRIANEDAQKGQVPAITGGGGGAIAFLAQQSEALEKHAGAFEGAFAARAEQMKGLSADQWEAFDVDAQAKVYEDLFRDLETAGRGVEDLRTPEQIATIIECHLWAAWIKNNHTTLIKLLADVWEEDAADVERRDPDELTNFGNDINQRLIDLGVEAAAHTGLYTHWWERNADGWKDAIMNWARTYNRTVAAK
jgi:hypothetical protein